MLENMEDLLHTLIHLKLWLIKASCSSLQGEAVWERLSKMEAHINERRGSDIWFEREANVVDVSIVSLHIHTRSHIRYIRNNARAHIIRSFEDSDW